jgi:hypothetical protein
VDKLDERFDGAMEALSDHLRSDADGGTVAVQVKRTLTTGALRSAAREAVAIDRFLERQGPASARSGWRFEVLTRRIEGAPAWSSVHLDDAEEHARLETLLRDGRLLGPREEPDARWRLVARVFPHLDRPPS